MQGFTVILSIFTLFAASTSCIQLLKPRTSMPYVQYGFEQPAGEREYAMLTPLGSQIRSAVNRNRNGEQITKIGVITYRERMANGGREYLFKLQMNNGLGPDDIWGASVFQPNQGPPTFQALFGPIDGYHGKLLDPVGPPERRLKKSNQ